MTEKEPAVVASVGVGARVVVAAVAARFAVGRIDAQWHRGIVAVTGCLRMQRLSCLLAPWDVVAWAGARR